MRSRSSLVLLAGVATMLMAGCGGGGENAFGEISGAVFDSDGNPVRDARVYIDGAETRTNSFGSYRISRAPARDITVRAEVDQGNGRYFGQNVASVYEGSDARSVNITLYPRSELASIVGATYDRQGYRLSGVRVFVRPINGSTLTSAVAVSDRDGNFKIGGLWANTDYELISNAQGYGDDTDAFNLAVGEERNLVVTLGNPINTAFQPPSDLSAVAWTSPNVASRSGDDAKFEGALSALKSELDPKRALRHTAKSSTRLTAAGNRVEVELDWFLPSGQSLLGYGVYRGSGANSLVDVDFLRDPLAELYTDSDQSLVEGQTYYYGLTSLSTSYPDTSDSESAFSDIVSVTTLGDITNTSVSGTTFNWTPALGATRYAVYLYDEYPRLGVTSRYNNFENPSVGSSFNYDGPALASGRTYYYLVLGLNGDGSARSVSRVSSFVAP